MSTLEELKKQKVVIEKQIKSQQKVKGLKP